MTLAVPGDIDGVKQCLDPMVCKGEHKNNPRKALNNSII